MTWFKFYNTALDDPKVQRLAPPVFKTWVNLLCLASRNHGVIPPLADMAFALRMDEGLADSHLMALIDAGLIDNANGGAMPHNWDKWQAKKDTTNAERQARYRQRNQEVNAINAVSNAVTPVTVTPPDNKIIDNRLDKDKDFLSETSSDPSQKKKSRNSYSEAFEEFWRAFPTDALMSKKNAAAQFAKLSEADQRKATEAVPAFRAYCEKNSDYRPVHAERFISQRRFDGFAETTLSAAKSPEDQRREFDMGLLLHAIARGTENPMHPSRIAKAQAFGLAVPHDVIEFSNLHFADQGDLK